MTDHVQFETLATHLAADQHGVVTRKQLLAGGVSSSAIDRRLASGWLQRVHRGVYRVGPVQSAHAPEMAACLSCGPDTFVSHRSAAAVWRLRAPRARPPRVEILGIRRIRRSHGIRTHVAGVLDRRETTRYKRIPITTPERTLLDLATSISERDLERAVAEGFALRLTTAEKVADLLERHRGRRGYRRLRDLVQGGRPTRTRSEFEEQFLRMVERARLGRPKVNVRVADYLVDFFWPRERVAVETDGFAFHSSKRSFVKDRRRDLTLAAQGVQVVRVSWEQWTEEREAVLAALAATLALATEQRGFS